MPRLGTGIPEPPRRGRHRTTVPARLIAAFAALLLTGGVVVAAGQASADPDSGSDSGLFSALGDSGSDSDADDPEAASEEGSDEGSDGGVDERAEEGSDENREDAAGSEGGSDEAAVTATDPDDPDDRGDNADSRNADGESSGNQGAAGGDAGGEEAEDPFPGRDKAGRAGADSYVDITEVAADGDRGEGGEFNGGSYSVDCGVSDHNNSDNYMAAPGKRNGAQHVHDYVGNDSTDAFSDGGSLEQAGTSCVNDDRSTFFWPVLRDLNGTGPDAEEDGGGLDGNEGSIMTPQSARLSFHGHGDEPVEPLPTHLMMITGNAKAGTAGGENANAKYTCTGFTDRVTDQYPLCPSGSQLVRFLDYPSCWDGENLDSEDLRSHVSFPDEQGNCSDGQTPIPALRITLTYDQPAGRDFALDSFPDQQHNPVTDHSDFENVSSEDASEAGADCINRGETCANLPQ